MYAGGLNCQDTQNVSEIGHKFEFEIFQAQCGW